MPENVSYPASLLPWRFGVEVIEVWSKLVGSFTDTLKAALDRIYRLFVGKVCFTRHPHHVTLDAIAVFDNITEPIKPSARRQ